MRKVAVLIVLASLSLGFAPAPKPRDNNNKKDMKLLQGTWQMVSLEATGRKMPAETAARYQVVIKDDRWTFILSGKELTPTTITIDARKKPKTIDMKRVGTPSTVMKGIYVLEGETLKICYRVGTTDADRPKTFAAEEGKTKTRSILITLKRVKP
jgi:uncharacterized protein (TIGR03067 family)